MNNGLSANCWNCAAPAWAAGSDRSAPKAAMSGTRMISMYWYGEAPSPISRPEALSTSNFSTDGRPLTTGRSLSRAQASYWATSTPGLRLNSTMTVCMTSSGVEYCGKLCPDKV
jgi:hypothetical protein